MLYRPTTPLLAGSKVVDIEVIEVSAAFDRRELPVTFSSDGTPFSAEAWFLGYPHGLGIHQGGKVIYPFMKRATVGGSVSYGNGVLQWMLDGINNPGFSGGPVAYYNDQKVPAIIGIVQGYRF